MPNIWGDFKRGRIGMFFGNDPNLVGYWQLQRNSLDNSGNGHNGTDTAITYRQQGFRDGMESAYFNGSSSVISLSSFPTNKSPASWSFWVNLYSVSSRSYGGGYGSTLIEGNENGDASGYVIGVNNSNKLWFWPSGNNDRFSTGTIPLNKWTHIVCTYNGSNLAIYINGALDSVQSMPVPQTPTFLKIGNKSWITGYMNGIMSEVAIFSRALSSQEISQYYNWAISNPKRNTLIIDPSLLYNPAISRRRLLLTR